MYLQEGSILIFIIPNRYNINKYSLKAQQTFHESQETFHDNFKIILDLIRSHFIQANS